MRATRTVAAGAIAVLTALGVGVGVGTESGAAPTATAAPVAGTTPPVAAPVAAPVALPAPRPTPPATVPGIPCSLPTHGDGACVSLSKQRAWLIEDGRVASSVPVATGKSGSTTPTGRFSVLDKDVDHWSKEFDAPMPYSVFFYPGDAFHTGSTSTRSNGCVHLSSSAAKAFYSTLSVGDPVQVVK